MIINKTLLNGAMFSIFSFINRGFSFILLLVLAKFFTPKEYGYLSLFNTVIMLMSYFSAFSTEGYISISYFEEGIRGVKKTVSGIFMISIFFIFIITLIYILFGNVIVEVLGLNKYILLLTVPITMSSLYASINLDYFRIQENIFNYGLLSCSNAMLNFILSIIIVQVMQYGWEGRVYAQASCGLLFGFFCIIVFL